MAQIRFHIINPTGSKLISKELLRDNAQVESREARESQASSKAREGFVPMIVFLEKNLILTHGSPTQLILVWHLIR